MMSRASRLAPAVGAGLVPGTGLVLGAALLLGLGLWSCAVNPATGERQLSLIGEGQEIEMGRQASGQVEAFFGLYDDAGLRAYVQRLGLGLANSSERPHLPWSFEVVDDPVVNAFALPGGFLYVTRGILAHFNSEAELAAVLGHEIGHVTGRHSVEQISRAQLAQLGFGVGSIFLDPLRGALGDALGFGVGVLFLQYSRDHERQADMLGVRYAFREGYDPREAIHVHEMLQRQTEEAGGSGIPGWLSTHPSPEDRIQRIRAQVDTLDQARLATTRVEREAYLRRIDGLVYGPNPRNGFFRGSLFLHPDLEFQLQFPDRWKTRNMARAVAAVSPREDAILQLTLAEEATHRAAADRFLAQRGIQTVRVSRDDVNGNPATVALFRASTQGGTLEGIAVFLEYRGRVYELLGFTPQGRYRSYESDFRRSIWSFDRLTDRAALAVQPMRIELLTPGQNTSIAALAQTRASPVSATRLAILNGVGERETIPAGRTIKWVVGEPPPGE